MLTSWPSDAQVDVVLLSGGLDSLVGALDTVVRGGFVVLVHHRESPRLDPRITALARALEARAKGRVAFVPAWITSETSGRGRPLHALLLAALGGVVASAFGAGSSVRFFENGVVSLALPVSAAGLGGSSKSTHPVVLAGFADIIRRLSRRPVIVDNGFLFSTKGEVAAQLLGHDATGLLEGTTSCQRETRRHCGACAACIDRRFAVLAAGLAEHDPADRYAVELLTGVRRGRSRAVASAYVQAAMQIADEDEATFFSRHRELARVLAVLPGDASIQAARLHDLHVRHAREVELVLDEGMRVHAAALRRGKLAGSLLALALPPASKLQVEVPKGPTVRVLHVSDFHFSARRAWDQDPVLAAMVEQAAAWTRAGRGPHLVAVTGDIADRGAKEEYARASEFFRDRLLPAVGLSTERLFVVPGNHDVDRGAVREVARATQDALLAAESQDVLAAVLGDARERPTLLRRHDAYLDFVGSLRGARPDVPWWSERIVVEGLTVHLAGVCSSFMAHSDADKGRLLVSRLQLAAILADAPTADLSLALVHHPWDYLADFDAAEVRERVQRVCTATLRGHLHAVDAAARVRPNDAHLELAAGACYGGAKHPHAFSLIELAPREGRVRLHPVLWDGVAFKPDRNVLGGSRDGVLLLSLIGR